MLPSLHRYSIGLEYKYPIFSKEKIIGYRPLYSSFYNSYLHYIVWNYNYSIIKYNSEWFIDKYATFVT